MSVWVVLRAGGECGGGGVASLDEVTKAMPTPINRAPTAVIGAGWFRGLMTSKRKARMTWGRGVVWLQVSGAYIGCCYGLRYGDGSACV